MNLLQPNMTSAQLDISALAPSCALLLDEIHFFNFRTVRADELVGIGRRGTGFEGMRLVSARV